jgi:uncharacterized SAM-binding protein YcdF (DUF218 family)
MPERHLVLGEAVITRKFGECLRCGVRGSYKVSAFKDRSTPRTVVVLSILLPVGLCILLIGLHKLPASLLLGPLETRFPMWRQEAARRVDGIIFLGGFHLEYNAGEWSGIPSVAAERVVTAVRLSKLYPEARVLYSGGGNEARLGKEILVGLGIPPEKISIEDRSRSTSENAKFSKIIAAPNRSETWLLVTSAYHMPRAVGAFRAAGFPVEACPVEFLGPKADKPGDDYVAKALREYIALIVYWLSGQSAELFPSPRRHQGTSPAKSLPIGT